VRGGGNSVGTGSGEGLKIVLKTSKLERVASKVEGFNTWPTIGPSITYLYVTARPGEAGTRIRLCQCCRSIPDDRSNIERFSSKLEWKTSKIEPSIKTTLADSSIFDRSMVRFSKHPARSES
jgi:hypothetical protein